MATTEGYTEQLRTALKVTISIVAPNERDEVVLNLDADTFQDEMFEAWLKPDEARALADRLRAAAECCERRRGLVR